MKNAILNGLLVMLLVVFLGACQKTEKQVLHEQSTETFSEGTGSPADKKSGVAWSPVGSKMEVAGNTTIVSPPPGWAYLGTATNGSVIHSTSYTQSKLTCTCNNGSGDCKPFEASGPWGTTSGCVGKCSDCSMKRNLTLPGGFGDVMSGGYYAPEARTRLLKDGESAPAVFDELLSLPTFKEAMNRLYVEAYGKFSPQQVVFYEDGSATAPKGYQLVAALVMGRAIMVVLPDAYVKSNLGYLASASASCKCSNTSGDCKLKSAKIFGMGSTWCEGTCNGCSLTTNTKLVDLNPYKVEIFGAKI